LWRFSSRRRFSAQRFSSTNTQWCAGPPRSCTAQDRHILFENGAFVGYAPFHATTNGNLEDQIMIYELAERRIAGSTGGLLIPAHDELTPRLMMLIEGECEALGKAAAAQKHGLTLQRYYQLLNGFREHGIHALQPQKRGPKSNYVRTEEVERQVIRHRFLDPDASVDVIAQKLRQAGFPISTRSVERVVEKYGLQKKTLSLPP
jgi:transposase